MELRSEHVVLESIDPELAGRIVRRDERPGDAWHPEYPFVDELDPLRRLAAAEDADEDFGMFLLRRTSDGLAVGGFGFFGPPDEHGRVEFGYGLVPAGRGAGLATEAVQLAMRHAQQRGARSAAADTDRTNTASQRVLATSGFTVVGTRGDLVLFERVLAPA
jgi:RimJ/RimL family protein N-acetyltransferase